MQGEFQKQLLSKSMLVYGFLKSKNRKRAQYKDSYDITECGGYEKMDVTGNQVIIYSGIAAVKIQVITDSIIRITLDKKECGEEYYSPALADTKRKNIEFKVLDDKDSVTVKTRLLTVKINKENLKIAFYDSQEVINEDYMSMSFTGEGVSCFKKLHSDECFYGFGEKTGPLNKRNWDTINWNTDESLKHDDTTKCLYSSIPFFIGLVDKKAYGIFFNNTYKTYFNMGKDNDEYYYFSSEGGNLDYYFIYGPGISEVVSGYSELTGRIEMPPLWSLGFQQCRWSYYPESRVMEIADNFRKRDIPCDVIYLDIDYMDGYRVFTWDKDRFPDFKGMIDKLHGMGFKIVTIIDPGVKYDRKYDVYMEGHKNNYFIKKPDDSEYIGKVWPMDSTFPDFIRPEVRSWWGSLNMRLLTAGVDGIWNDMNEPSVFNSDTKTAPEEAIHEINDKKYYHKQFHNIYGMMMDMGTYEGFKETGINKRPFILTRSAFAGIQRYSALWTGDNMSLWEHLKLSISMNCNLGLSGLPFTGSDVGGFGKDCSEELLIRWTQAAAFLPFFRNHSSIMTRNQEPWAFGKRAEDICREFIKLRYRLIPYIYNLFYRAYKYGIPVARPLVYEYQDDKNTYNINDEFMLGDCMLIAPIVEEGSTSRSLYLPEGKWYDFFSNSEFEGGKEITFDAPIDTIPVFIKSGSIIPMKEAMSYTGERKTDMLEINIAPGANGELELYEDDGSTLDYKSGKFNITQIKYAENETICNISISEKYHGFDREYSKYCIIFKNALKPFEIAVTDGSRKPVSYKAEYTDKNLEIIIEALSDIQIILSK